MKNLVAKLKELNYKQLLVQHAEKFVFGMVGLFVLICFAGTSWSRYDKQPEDFTKKVDSGTAAINASAWTPERQKDFQTTRDIMGAVEQLHSTLDPSRFQYSTHWFWPMYPQQEPVKEPKWWALESMIADGGKVIIQELPEAPTEDLLVKIDDSAKTDGTGDTAADDGTAPRRTTAATAGSDTGPRSPLGVGGAAPSPGGISRLGKGGGAGGIAPPGGLGGISSGGVVRGEAEGDYGGLGLGMGIAPTAKSRGARFVAVRGVFPLKDQIDELAKTMHLLPSEAAAFCEFLDFEVERQVGVPGQKDWNGKWEPVNLQVALEILAKVNFDTEVIDAAYTEAVFTMPLVQRVAGSWSRYASHPKIKELDLKMQEAQVLFTKQLVDQAEEMKKADLTRKRGFADLQHDVRGMRGMMTGSNMQTMMQNLQQDLGGGMSSPYTRGLSIDNYGRDMEGAASMFMNQAQNNSGRMSQFLLFRYFDFDVTPGNAYVYRARLVLRNPNFKRPVEELLDESVAVGEIRQTPWSDQTLPIIVPDEERVFLTKVDRSRPEAGTPASAYFDIYQWFSDAGTLVSAKLEKVQLGQFVGGSTKTEVLRPEVSLREETLPIFTGSVLADIASPPVTDLDPNEHADLRVDVRRVKGIGATDKALLVDRYGQLQTLDPSGSSDDLETAKKNLKAQNTPWEFLKQQQEQNLGADSDLGRMMDRMRGGRGGVGGEAEGGGDYGMMGGMGQMNPAKKGGKSPNSKAGGSKKKTKGRGLGPGGDAG